MIVFAAAELHAAAAGLAAATAAATAADPVAAAADSTAAAVTVLPPLLPPLLPLLHPVITCAREGREFSDGCPGRARGVCGRLDRLHRFHARARRNQAVHGIISDVLHR